jgi:hypothetical protein
LKSFDPVFSGGGEALWHVRCTRVPATRSPRSAPKQNNPNQEFIMIRSIFLALALLLPVSWTVARAADEAPAGEKKEKKAKKGKKADGAEGEKKAEEKK